MRAFVDVLKKILEWQYDEIVEADGIIPVWDDQVFKLLLKSGGENVVYPRTQTKDSTKIGSVC